MYMHNVVKVRKLSLHESFSQEIPCLFNVFWENNDVIHQIGVIADDRRKNLWDRSRRHIYKRPDSHSVGKDIINIQAHILTFQQLAYSLTSLFNQTRASS